MVLAALGFHEFCVRQSMKGSGRWNISFETVIHPSAVIAPEVHIDDGVQVMAGAIVQPGSWLGENVIINTGARVDHDCTIDAHAHVAPGVTLSGNVHVGNGAHIGAGATVIQGIKVGTPVPSSARGRL